MTMRECILAHGIELEAKRADHNPQMGDTRDMDHWAVTLHNEVEE